MAQMITDSYREFLGGVVTSGLPSRQDRSSSPKGWNSILTNLSPTSATPAKRPGLTTINTSNGRISANGVQGQWEYRITTQSYPAFTTYHVTVDSAGEIGRIASEPGGAGTYTTIQSTVFTGGYTKPIGGANAKNLLFLTQASVDQKKLRGTSLEEWGISRPGTATSVAAGAAGVMTGTFQVRVTFYNSNTGHESSASDTSASQTLSAQQLSLTNIPTSSDGQVTDRKIYIRNTATQTAFRLASTLSGNVSTSTTLNVDTSTLTTLGPNTTENDPPPATVHSAAWVNSFMFVADDQNLYWSKKNYPESFDAEDFEPIGANDGQKIVGLLGYGDVLLIFKNRSVYALTGLTPASWRIRPLFQDIGAVSGRSIKVVNGAIFWWSEKGPVMWDGTGPPRKVGELLLGDIDWNKAYPHLIDSEVDTTLELVMWSYPEGSQTRNTRMVAFNYRLQAFVTDKWDAMDVASLASVEHSDGERYVYFGNHNGQVFRFGDATNDGVPGGTDTGTFIAAGTSTTTITDAGFYTTGRGLEERYVSVVDSNRQLVARRRISSNTATVLTLASSVTGLTVGATYTYYIGGPNFEWATPLDDSGRPFEQKRYHHAYVKAERNDALVGVDIYTDADEDTPKRYLSFTGTDNEKSTISKRLTAACVGIEWQMVVTQREPDVEVTLYDIAMRSEPLTDKLG
jgi:hypothetical protein